MSRNPQYHSEDLAKFFQKKKIATMGELKHALGTQVDVTVFRKLRPLAYRTSYSDRGRYYTLDRIARFDERGLWAYRGVYFSKQGTLRRTAEALVHASEAGCFAEELERLLQVRVKDPLRELCRQGRLTRERVTGRYLYCSSKGPTRKQQLRVRHLQEQQRSLGPSPGEAVASDEVRAAVVLFFSLLDEQQRRLYAGLESLKWGHGGDRRVACLLGLDVATIAKGRHELLAADILTDRIRKPGAGRKPLEKKRPK
ncbi:MAG: hypothetical protein GY788_32935 [bacterium]|nr:hypothetical protein [bacterium]